MQVSDPSQPCLVYPIGYYDESGAYHSLPPPNSENRLPIYPEDYHAPPPVHPPPQPHYQAPPPTHAPPPQQYYQTPPPHPNIPMAQPVYAMPEVSVAPTSSPPTQLATQQTAGRRFRTRRRGHRGHGGNSDLHQALIFNNDAVIVPEQNPTSPRPMSPALSQEDVITLESLQYVQVHEELKDESSSVPFIIKFATFRTDHGEMVKGYQWHGNTYLIDSLLQYVFDFLAKEHNINMVETSCMPNISYAHLLGLEIPSTRVIFPRKILTHLLKVYEEIFQIERITHPQLSAKFLNLFRGLCDLYRVDEKHFLSISSQALQRLMPSFLDKFCHIEAKIQEKALFIKGPTGRLEQIFKVDGKIYHASNYQEDDETLVRDEAGAIFILLQDETGKIFLRPK